LRRVALLALLALLVAVPAARADADPASDYLLSLQTFVPPDAGVSKADQQQLTQLVTSARSGGYTIRVAVIASRYDLGSVTILDKRPKLYAHFLSQELRFLYKQRVLVVMANGYGIARGGKPAPAEQKIVDRLPPPTAMHGSALVAATERAVRTLANHAGVQTVATPIPAAATTKSTTTRDRVVIAAVALAVLCATIVVFLYRRWLRGPAAPARRRAP
jgi:hypothetical protein